MKIKYIYIALIVALFLFEGCDTGSEIAFDTDTVVVNGYLFGGENIDSFRITKSNSYSETIDSLETFDNLEVSISDGNQTFLLASIGNGYYQNLNQIIENEKTYELSFDYNGKNIYSTTYVPAQKEVSISANSIAVEKIELGTMPSFTATDPIQLTWDNSENDYYYVVIENIESEPEYINERQATQARPRPFVFITEPSVMNSYNIDTRRDVEQFGTHQIVVFRVNPEYAALYATADATSSSIVEPPTNIENGLGIFTGVSSDTLYLEVNKL
jgi:hypothetical protein